MRLTRTLTIAVAASLVTGVSASAQDWARNMFKKRSHDFGTVARGAHAEYRFTFRNPYRETLRVASVRSSCGCTEPGVTQRTVKSGETSEIVAVYNTTAFKGARSATVTVVFDQPYYAEVQLQVKGYIRRDVVLTPGSVNFGRVDHGSKSEQRIGVHYAGHNGWQIVDVRTANPHLETKLTETGRGGGEVKYELAVRLLPGAPLGYVKDQLTLVTNDQRLVTLPIDVEGKVESEITVSPATMLLGVLKPGQQVTQRIVVRGRRPFRITHVKCDNDGFQFKTPEVAKVYHVIPVTFTANESGRILANIHIETDLGQDVVPKVSVHAQIAD